MKTNLLVRVFRRYQIRNLVVSLVVAATGLIVPESARAFSITDVTLTPASPVPAGSNIVMTVNIAAPSAPVWLYQAAEISVQGDQVFVDLYPASGLLTVVGHLSTNVVLGVLPGDTYQYEVRLHPQFPSSWGVRTNRGSFTVVPGYPWTMVTVTAPDPDAAEPGVPVAINPGRFTFHRSGTANIELVVGFAIGGTASNGVDYAALSKIVRIPAGQRAVDVLVNPLADVLVEGTETVALRVLPPACPAIYPPPPECYLVGTPREATVSIADNSPNTRPVVTIVARDPVAAEGTNCYRWPGWPTPLPANHFGGTNTATFVVRRAGPTNDSLTVFYMTGGTAINGVDYRSLPGTIVIPAGQRVAPIVVVPVDDALPERIETVVLRLIEPPYGSPLPSPYLVGKPARAAAIIADNDQPRPCTGRLPDRCFHLMQPANGAWFRIECSPDLVNWTVLCTNTVTDGAIHFVDPDADDESQRFYRAVPETNPPAE